MALTVRSRILLTRKMLGTVDQVVETGLTNKGLISLLSCLLRMHLLANPDRFSRETHIKPK